MNSILESLLNGNKASMANHGDDLLIKELIENGQHPKAVVLACSDSRVCPERLFDVQAGEIFVIRVAGNALTPEVLASMEYAVLELKTPLILVLGHTQCGAVKVALANSSQNTPTSPNLKKLLDGIIAHLPRADQGLKQSILNHTLGVVRDIPSRSPILKKAVEDKVLEIHGALHHLRSGKVQIL